VILIEYFVTINVEHSQSLLIDSMKRVVIGGIKEDETMRLSRSRPLDSWLADRDDHHGQRSVIYALRMITRFIHPIRAKKTI
jgi:hypothetical protein